MIKIECPKDEWLQDFVPQPSIELDTDIFSFWQRFPDVKPHYQNKFHMEWDNVAVLEITTFQNWWKNQVNRKTRNMIRKAQKHGVIVKEIIPDDCFFFGVTKIYNETPIRQGTTFKHYGRTFQDVKQKFIEWRNPKANTYIGAYCQNELIGFIHLIHTDKYSLMSQIISFMKHFNKAPNNALIAKAVEICAEKGVKYLIYARWSYGSLGDFKRHNGFQRHLVPRYYIPLTLKGKIALRLHLHHGWRGIIPNFMKKELRKARQWYWIKMFANKR